MSRSRLETFLDTALGLPEAPGAEAATVAADAAEAGAGAGAAYRAKVARARARMLGQASSGPVDPETLEDAELQRLALILHGAQTGDFFALMRERGVDLGVDSIAAVAAADARGAPALGTGQLRHLVICLSACEIDLQQVSDEDLAWLVELTTATEPPACPADPAARARWRARLIERFVAAAAAAPPPAGGPAEPEPEDLVEGDEQLQDHMDQRRAQLAEQAAAVPTVTESRRDTALAFLRDPATLADLPAVPDHPRAAYAAELAAGCARRLAEVRASLAAAPADSAAAAACFADPAGLGRQLTRYSQELDELKQQCEGPMIMIRRDSPNNPASEMLGALQDTCVRNMTAVRKMRHGLDDLSRQVCA